MKSYKIQGTKRWKRRSSSLRRGAAFCLAAGLLAAAVGCEVSYAEEVLIAPGMEWQPGTPQLLQSESGSCQVNVERITTGEHVSFDYPVLTNIEGFDQSVLDAVNLHFREVAMKELEEQSATLEASRKDIQEFNPEAADQLAFEVTCESLYLSGDTFSVMQFYYTYFGGAHGYSFCTGTSFDLKSGEELTMSDLLGCDNATAEEAVVEAYRQDIIGQVENITEESIRGSFTAMAYWLSEEGMYVNLPPYAVASYAAGPQQVIVTPEIVERASWLLSVNGLPEKMLTVIGGIQAPAADFILPDSSVRELTMEDLSVLEGATVEEAHDRSQLAINEILARYGYVFHPEQGGSAKEAYDQFEGRSWYEEAKLYCPSTSANEMLYTYITSLELQNIELICEWQKEHDCYY